LYLIDETIPYSLEYYLGIKREDYEDEECNSCGGSEEEEDSEEEEHDKMPKRKKSGGVKKKSEDEIEKKNVRINCFKICVEER